MEPIYTVVILVDERELFPLVVDDNLSQSAREQTGLGKKTSGVHVIFAVRHIVLGHPMGYDVRYAQFIAH